MIIFDVDGVLVDVSESFLRTVIDTVKYFTGVRVTHAQIHEWKNRAGYNDDWKLSHVWVNSLGAKHSYKKVKQKFLEIFWGTKGRPGNVRGERWLLSRAVLGRLKKRAELALFTGRVKRELNHTLDGLGLRGYFTKIVTVENVEKPKPDPEGLLLILGKRDSARALYVGDNVDDGRAAKKAKIPFVGLLPYRSHARKFRLKKLQKLGAVAVLGNVRELEAWLKRRTS